MSAPNPSDIVAVTTPRGVIEVARQQLRSQGPNSPWQTVWVARRRGQIAWRRGSTAAEAIRQATLLAPTKKVPWLANAAAQAERDVIAGLEAGGLEVVGDVQEVLVIDPTSGISTIAGASGPVALGLGNPADGWPTILIENALERLVEGYLLGDLKSMATEIRLKEMGAVGYPMVMAVLAGSELLGALTTDVKQPNRIKTYWQKYLAEVDVRYGDLAEIAAELARHGIAHSYLSHFGVVVVRGQPEQHLSLRGGEVVFDCIELYYHFRESYERHARPDILRHLADAQGRLDALLQHDHEKASSLIKRLPPERFPHLITLSVSTESAAASGVKMLATGHLDHSDSPGPARRA